MAITAPAAGESLKANEKKWTKELMAAGWTVIPNVFLERQKAFGFDALDINILMHLASYWWHPDNKPHPSKVTIAEAMGIDPRTVQRRIAKMEAAGFLKREERRVSKVGSKSNIYHFDGLIKEAKPFAKEMVDIKKAKVAMKDALRAKKGKPTLKLVKTDE
jgi:predicted transcriptional regulator